MSVSDDRRELTIVTSEGRRAVYRSGRADGFTDADFAAADTIAFSTRMPGQATRAREVSVGAWVVRLHVNLGRPTWWWPQI